MKEDRSDSNGGHRSWLEKLSFALLGEPKDQDELLDILRDAHERNLLDIDAFRMMQGVMEVSEMQVRDIMLPRSQMVVVEQDWDQERVLNEVLDSGHSRFPVIKDNRDDVIGILLVKDLLRFLAKGNGVFVLQDLLRPAKFIPESKRLNALLKEFRLNRLHMAIVVDEYGGVAGLVTIEDVLEQIVGEIDDEHDIDEAAPSIRLQNNNKYLVKALTPVEDFNDYFQADLSDEKADTIGGLVMMELGRLPKRGEVAELGIYHFQVLRADNRRLHLLELTLLDEVNAH